MNLLSSIVVDASLSVSHKHFKEVVDFQQMIKENVFSTIVKALNNEVSRDQRRGFMEVNFQRPGNVTMNGFAEAMSTPSVQEELDKIGIEEDEIEDIIDLIVACNDKQDLPVQEFDQGMRHLRGSSSNNHLLMLRYDFQAHTRALHGRMELLHGVLLKLSGAQSSAFETLLVSLEHLRRMGNPAALDRELREDVPFLPVESSSSSWLEVIVPELPGELPEPCWTAAALARLQAQEQSSWLDSSGDDTDDSLTRAMKGLRRRLKPR